MILEHPLYHSSFSHTLFQPLWTFSLGTPSQAFYAPSLCLQLHWWCQYPHTLFFPHSIHVLSHRLSLGLFLSFSWICTNITSLKKSSLIIQSKEVQFCPIILHLITPFYECINLSHLFTWLFAHCPSPVRMQAPSKQCLSCLLLVSRVPRRVMVHNRNQLWLDRGMSLL